MIQKPGFAKESFSCTLTDCEDQEHHYTFVIKDFANLTGTIQLNGQFLIDMSNNWEEFAISLFCFTDYIDNTLFTLRMHTFDGLLEVDAKLTLLNDDGSVIPFASESFMQSGEGHSFEYSEYGDRDQIIKAMKGTSLKVDAHMFLELVCSEDVDTYYPRGTSEKQVNIMMKSYRDAYNDPNESDLKFVIHDIKTKRKETIFVNRTMLMARSPYFREILSCNENATVLIEQQFEKETVDAVLAYIYGHSITDLEDDVFKYLRIAFKYQLYYLLERIDEYLCANMPGNDDDMIFLELSSKYDLQRLRRRLLERYAVEKKDSDGLDKWQRLVAEDPSLEEELMRLLIIDDNDEEEAEITDEDKKEDEESSENDDSAFE